MSINSFRILSSFVTVFSDRMENCIRSLPQDNKEKYNLRVELPRITWAKLFPVNPGDHSINLQKPAELGLAPHRTLVTASILKIYFLCI
jgi:hypothetical protein